MKEKHLFHVQINGGPEQKIEVTTSEYQLAAITCLGILEYDRLDDYNTVKIWIPDLVEAGYGPYFYAYDGHNIGFPEKSREW